MSVYRASGSLGLGNAGNQSCIQLQFAVQSQMRILLMCDTGSFYYFVNQCVLCTVVTFLFDSVFTWVIVVPAAYLLAHFTGLGIVGIYFLVQGTELIKVIIGYIMVKSNVWVVQMV